MTDYPPGHASQTDEANPGGAPGSAGASFVTASKLVTLGIDKDPETAHARCLVESLLSFRPADKICDPEGVYYVTLDGMRWYGRCKGKCESFWEESEASLLNRRNVSRNAIGLPASAEWRELWPVRHDPTKAPFMIVCMHRCAITEGVMAPHQIKWLYGNAYCIVRSREDFLRLYRRFPPADRFLHEVFLPETPHKCIMDIEKDLDDLGLCEAELDREMHFLHTGLHELFIPFLCSFFHAKLGINADPSHCYVMDSSKRGAKFSIHLVVHTPRVHYFRNRTDAWVVMNALASFLDERARCNPNFHRWLFHEDTQGRQRCTWDFGVYNAGSRSMRLIGAGKGHKRVLNTHWKHCRVFEPITAQKDAPFDRFIGSAYAYRERTAIEVSTAVKAEAYRYCVRMRGLARSPYWYQNSRNIASFMLQSEYISSEERQQLGPTLQQAYGGSAAGGGGGGGVREALFRISKAILAMGNASDSGGLASAGSLDEETRNERAICRNRFLAAIRRLVEQVAAIVHPGNPVTVEFEPSPFGIASARMSAWVNGNQDEGRRCYFGCTAGSHMVILNARADFAVSYFCYACRKKATLLKTPIRAHCVQPRDIDAAVPEDFRGGVIDYDAVPHDPAAGEDEVHMRPIRALDDGSFVLGGTSTVIMHGRMGTGKTVATKAFLQRVREEKPDARIVAFSFRKMLAQMFADSFDLVNYTSSEERSLYDERGLAVQLESIERLGTPWEGGSTSSSNGTDGHPSDRAMSYHATYDVIVLDEVESLLAHFSSSTMQDRLSVVWKLFFHLTRRCRALVVCDADVGPRTFQFLRMARARPDSQGRMRVPNLQYHINRYIAIRTRFIDYAGQSEWRDALIRTLLAGKNVFYFSNNKTHMRSLELHIRDSLTRWKQRRIADLAAQSGPDLDMDAILSDSVIVGYDEILENIKIIDADISETEKKKLSNCNEEWVRMRMVMISPTVGAGIDFVRSHFHKAFGYATYSSCPARALNQMRGRARVTIDRECHLFIQDNPEYDNGIEDDIEECQRNGLAVTLDDAYASLTTNRNSYTNDMAVVTECRDDGTEHIVARTTSIPRQLQTTLAYNLVEANRSHICFRGQLINILQGGDPDLDYTFLTSIDHGKNHGLRLDLLHRQRESGDAKRARIAAQGEMDIDAFQELRAADIGGDESLLVEHPALNATLDKNHVKHFYGVRDDVGPETWGHILRLGGDNTTLERVRNFAFILCGSVQSLYTSAIRRGSLQSLNFRLLSEQGEAAIEEMTVKQRTAQEVWPGDHVVRWWTTKLMYASGFEFPTENGEAQATITPEDLNRGMNPGNIMPGYKGLAAHKGIADYRLRDPALQEWLWQRNDYIKSKSRIKSNKRNTPETGAAWEWKHVSYFTNEFLVHWFGINSRKSAQRKRKRGGDGPPGDDDTASLVESIRQTSDAGRSGDSASERYDTGILAHTRQGYYCGEPHPDPITNQPCSDRCKLMRVDAPILQTMLSLAYCHLHTPYRGRGTEPEVRSRAREQVTRILAESGMEQVLRDCIDTGGAGQHPFSGDGAVAGPQGDAAAAEDEDGYENEYEYGQGYNDFGGYGDNDYAADAEYSLAYDPSSVTGGAPEADFPDEARPSTSSVLEEIPTLAEKDLAIRLLNASRTATERDGRKDESADAYRRDTVLRYVGPSPYGLDADEFVILLLSGAYQARVRRGVERLKKSVAETLSGR